MGAVVAIFYAQLFLSEKSLQSFKEVKTGKNKKGMIQRKNSLLKTKYQQDKHGKMRKVTMRVDFDEHGITIPKNRKPESIWKTRVRGMVLDSPFTDLISMLQSTSLNSSPFLTSKIC